MNCLKVLRWTISFPLMILLFLIVTVGITLASFAKVTTDKNSIKNWLEEGNVYNQVVDVVFDQVLKQANLDQNQENMVLSESELKDVVKNVLTEDWLQQQVEGSIDATYSWLDKKTESPQISITLKDQEEPVVDAMINIFKTKIATLPDCTTASEMKDFNPFEAECKPEGFVMNDEIEAYFADEFRQQDFLKDASISPEDIKIDKNVSDKVQTGYSIAKKLPLLIWAVVGIAALVLFVMIPGLKNSFFFTGFILFISSGLLLIAGYLVKHNYDSFVDKQLSDQTIDFIDILSALLKGPLKLAAFDVIATGANYALVLVVIGIILVLGSFILRFAKPKYIMKGDSKENGDNSIGSERGEDTERSKGKGSSSASVSSAVLERSPDENGTSIARKVNTMKKNHEGN